MNELEELLTHCDLSEIDKSERELLVPILEETGQILWIPQPGPQTKAANSEAFEILYGGEAGGGKSNLIQGIARTRHINSVIFRRTYTRLEDSVIPDTIKFYGNLKNLNRSKHFWQFGSQRISLRQMEQETDVFNYKSAQFDFIGVDELTEFTQLQYEYIISRCRTVSEGQRTRIVSGSNPAATNEGMWVFNRWAAWLDEKHPNPALDGEIRYFVRNNNGDEVEVPRDDVGSYDPSPISRTFIRARLSDNRYLDDSYRSTLAILPEPYRSQLLEGVWGSGIEDDRWQVIPTNWVKLANERWKKNTINNMVAGNKNNGSDGSRVSIKTIDSIGVDVAHGGKDKTVLSIRQGNYFSELSKIPGRETPDGQTVAQLIFKALDGKQHEKTYVNIDATGVGASAYDFTKDQGDVRAFVAAGKSTAKDKSGKLTFINKRAESYWLFREALDPQSGEDIALPPDQELLADLTAPRWKMMSNGIQIEKKEDLIKRLGRSPDCGDAVVLAFHGKNEAPASGALVEMNYGMRRRF